MIGDQGGDDEGCNVPSAAVAIEASISAVAPRTGGYFRSWPEGVEPNATILNFSANRATTNTGTITLADAETDLQAKSYGGPAHYVIDVQGFYVPVSAGEN